jgi:outer membrane protein OmpA-like peptidoglycan-associated protein
MTHARKVFALVAVAAGLQMACGPFRSRTPQPKGQATVVLLPESDGSVGRAAVSNSSGNVELSTARASTRVVPGEAPEAVREMSESDVRRLFADAIAAQPAAPAHYTLYFEFDSDELTAESQKLVSQVQQSVKMYPAPQVAVVGHTDTTGSATANIGLGLRRAEVVRTRLIEAGVDRSAIVVTSHGEATLLVPTADDVNEPKNRRVDITVR